MQIDLNLFSAPQFQVAREGGHGEKNLRKTASLGVEGEIHISILIILFSRKRGLLYFVFAVDF